MSCGRDSTPTGRTPESQVRPRLGRPVQSDPEPAPGCVDVNSASLEAQQEIVHIGVTRAQDIVDGRPWSTVEQLDQIDGIGPAHPQDILDQNLACVT